MPPPGVTYRLQHHSCGVEAQLLGQGTSMTCAHMCLHKRCSEACLDMEGQVGLEGCPDRLKTTNEKIYEPHMPSPEMDRSRGVNGVRWGLMG